MDAFDIDTQERHDFHAPYALECVNCHSSSGLVEAYWSVDGTKLPLCEACAEEERSIEERADELAKLPSCEERQGIIDSARSVRELAHRLKAHDQRCACVGRKQAGTSKSIEERAA